MKRRIKTSVKKVERAVRLEQLAGQLTLSQEVLSGSIRMVVYGKSCIRLENYKGILDYTDTNIKILSNDGRIQIEGKRLQISYCSDVELCVMGNIRQIQYME